MKWQPEDYVKNSNNQLAWARGLIAKLNLAGTESVLDVGCGDGKISAELAQTLPQGFVLGVDRSAEFVDYARQHYPPSIYPHLRFEQMDARQLTSDRQFDLIFSNAALHWVDDHRAFLAGCARLLNPAGRLVVSCGGAGNAATILAVMNRLIEKPQWQPYFCHFSFPYYFYAPADYQRWLPESGLRPIRLELVEKEMTHQGREGLAGWIRSTWLPYTQRLPEELQEQFIIEGVEDYLREYPLDELGQSRVRMVRLEVEACLSTNDQLVRMKGLDGTMVKTGVMNNFVPGLEGVIAAETRLSSVDGQAGELIIAGFPVEELAGQATFEETIYLLWHDSLPTAAQLAEFRAALAAQRELPAMTMDLLRAAGSQKVAVIDALRMAAGTLSLQGQDDPEQQALALIAVFPTVVAAYWRLRNGQEPLPPRPDLGHAANYLFMLFDQTPSAEHVRGLETYLNTVVDHGMNASTFTARVIISTQSDLVSAVAGALGALKGPLHGGAPGPALDMVFEIGDSANAEAYLRQKLERGERLMGFGHRIYKVRDPRAEVLSAAAARMFQGNSHQALYQLSRQVEQTAVALLAEYKPGRNLQTNVEFYTALLLHGLGLTADLFTPTFAIGRVAGWIAHCFEQQQLSRLIRPQSVYVGSKNRGWIPLEQRG